MKPRFAIVLGLALAACQTAPAPEDNFYRLLPVTVAPELPQPVRQGGMAVEVLRADSLYSERAVVYADADHPRLLKQYHYHLWLYPPGQLVQEQLVASLRRSNPGAAVVQGERAAPARYTVTGRVLRFERVVAPEGATAVVELELALESGDAAAPLLRRTYSAEAAAPRATVGGFGEAMEQALERIYSAFAADILGVVPQR